MNQNILIVGATGLIGKEIELQLRRRNSQLTIYKGSRTAPLGDKLSIRMDVDDRKSLEVIAIHNIQLIVMCAEDNYNNILKLCIEKNIHYIDITKPTKNLEEAYEIAKKGNINSKIVFSSGWMSGVVSSLVFNAVPKKNTIKGVQLFIYYSIKDKAGKSSAHFLANNVTSKFNFYRDGKPVVVKHFLDTISHEFKFGIGNMQVYNLDVPDLFLLNKIEGIPNVEVKVTYNSKLISSFLGLLQKFHIFDLLPLSLKKILFSGNGEGDKSVFDIKIVFDGKSIIIRFLNKKGQSDTTSYATVLYIEKMLEKGSNGLFFSHQLYEPSELFKLLKKSESITILVE